LTPPARNRDTLCVARWIQARVQEQVVKPGPAH